MKHFLLFNRTAILVFVTGLCMNIARAEAPSAQTIARIQAVLARPDVMCGRFDQTKKLTGMSRPLLSNGRFCVITGKGVLWRTLQPFPNTLRLTRTEIVQMQGDRVAMHMNAEQEPVVKMINNVLFSLLAGDLSQLSSLFDLDGKIHDNQWQVQLKAKQPALAKAIGDIALEGSDYVRKVTMQEAGGDHTDIVFSDIHTGEHVMTAEDSALFN